MLKRTFDVIVSAFFLFTFSPFFLLIAMFIKVDSEGPVLYRAQRIGKGGKPFTLYKFRTMVANAPNQGPGITRDADPRITRVGRFLRKMKIDEMPQLINVLKGDMSIVGPRPEDPRYVAHYTAEQRRVLSVRPGMASPTFIKYRYEEEVLAAAGDDLEHVYLTQILPDKLRMDLGYIEQQSFLGDLAILAQAVLSLFWNPDISSTARSRAARNAPGDGC